METVEAKQKTSSGTHSKKLNDKKSNVQIGDQRQQISLNMEGTEMNFDKGLINPGLHVTVLVLPAYYSDVSFADSGASSPGGY